MNKGYYPLSFLQQRPYARAFLKFVAAQTQGMAPAKAEQEASGLVLAFLRQNGWKPDQPGAMAAMAQEVQGLLAFGQWSQQRAIVDILPPLSEAFARSDSGDMRIADVAPPPGSYYFRFNLPEDMALRYSAEQVTFEGAYVLHFEDTSTRVVLCGIADGRLPLAERWKERYDLRISRRHFELPADEAVAAALADDLADLRSARDRLLTQGSLEALPEVDLLTARMTADHGAYSKAVKLVLNALAYWKFVPEDQGLDWTEGAPGRLVALADSGAPRAKERATSKLWALGHIPVHRLGPRFSAVAAQAHGAGVKAHWRRGHWRQQAHGPRLTLRKLIWIAPVSVGADAS